MIRRGVQAAAALCAVLYLTACSGGLEADREAAAKRIEAYLATRPGLDPDTASEMRAFRLRSGMTEDEVRATWGEPEDVLKRSDDVVEWRFACAFPHLCRARPGAGAAPPLIKPNAFFVKGRLERWNQ